MSQTPPSRHSSLFHRISKQIALAIGLALPLAACSPASGQMQLVPQITTIVGTGTAGYSGDGGPATNAQLQGPRGIASDRAGNVYVADIANNVVRRIDASTGVITTVAGTGTAGYSGDVGPATSAQLKSPNGVAVDSQGNLYISDTGNNCLRLVAAGTSIITTIATGFTPTDLAIDRAHNLYISDNTGHYVRKMAPGATTTTIVAGNGSTTVSGEGGPATSAGLGTIASITVDGENNLYIAAGPFLVNRIRMVNATTGIITTVAGNGTSGYTGDGGPATSAQLAGALSIAMDAAGNLYIGDGTSRIRKVSSGIITTIAGTGTQGNNGDSESAILAQIDVARMAMDASGNLYFTDQIDNVVRKLTFPSFPATNLGASSATETFYLEATAAETISSINAPQSLGGKQEYTIGTITGCMVDGTPVNPAGTVCTVPITFTPAYPGKRWAPLQVVTSTGNINFGLQGVGVGPLAALTPGIISTYAGVGTQGFSGDNGLATSAQITVDFASAVDSSGNLYFPDGGHIRRVDSDSKTIKTIANAGANNLAFDSAGYLYFSSAFYLSKLDVLTGIVSAVAGNGVSGYTGDGGPALNARLKSPQGIAFDSAGNIYFADAGNLRIRKVAKGSGIITTYAGSGSYGTSGDNGAATGAAFEDMYGIAFDSKDNLYVVDRLPCVIRKIDGQTHIITTVAGSPISGFSGDGAPAVNAKLNWPVEIAIDAADNLYISDSNNHRIRKISAATGIITTVAGDGTKGFAGDGGPATNAQIATPQGLAFDGVSSLYIGGYQNYYIRKVDLSNSQLTYPTPTTAGTLDSADGPQSVVLSNIGNADLTGASPSNGTNPAISADFTYDSSSTCPQLLPSSVPSALSAGQDCTLAINFQPTAEGSITGSAVITNNSLNAAEATQTVQLSGTATDPNSTKVNSSLNPSTYGQAVTFTATVTVGSGTPTGTVQFGVDGIAVGVPVTVSGGTAAYTTSALAGGSRMVTATFTPADSSQQGSTGSITQIVNPQSTKTSITASPTPSLYGQTVTLTAKVAPTTGATVPTGTVQFFIDNVAAGSPAAVINGMAIFTTNTLAVATHPVKATYTPDSGNFKGSSTPSFPPITAKVTAATTTTTVVGAANPSAALQTVLFTATVAPTAGTAVPTGTVQFAIDGTNVGSPVTLINGKASYTTNTLTDGSHPVTAVYTPSGVNFTGSNGSTTEVVTTVTSSTTTLSVAPTTGMYGDTATLTAVVSPGIATGTVSFYEGTTLLGTASLDNTGTAVLPIGTLNAGVHAITAKYNGDPIVPASTSNNAQLTVTKRTAQGGGPAITVTVNDAARTASQTNPPFTYSAAGQLINGNTYSTVISGTPSYSTSGGTSAGAFAVTVAGLTSANYEIAFLPGTLTVTISPSTTTLVAGPSSTQYGDTVTLTATVTAGATGTVSFYDGAVLLGTAQVTNGVATLTTTTLIAGTHAVAAVYNGDATYASSQSGPATVTVAKKTAPGGGAALTITVQNASREYNTADPQFAYVVTGTLVNNDTYATAVTGAPVYSSTDTATSAAGSTFPISEGGLSSANYEIAVVNGTLTIVAAPTTTTLTTNTASAQYGDPVTLTATVAPGGATGTVLFMEGSTVLGTGAVANGVATLAISSLPAGSYTITASYEGDANYSASTSGPVSLTIGQKTGPGGIAALTVTVTNASRPYGQGNPAFIYTVTGTLVNGDTYATAFTGVPVYSTAAVPLSPAGGYPISVAGLNSQNYLVTIVNGTLTVAKDTPGQSGSADITLTSSPNPSLLGQSVTFTATVPVGATGTVQFMEGSTLLGTGTISGTSATLTTSSLATGTYPITAVYSGDGNYNAATSAVDNQVVNNGLDFTLTLTSAGTQTVIPGDAAPYAVQVAPTNVNYPGTVTFSATGLPAGATISFSPATVAADAGVTPSSVKVQTAQQKAALNSGSIGSAVLALLMLPFATSRRMRRSSRRYFYLLILVLGGIGATAGLTGCGYNGNGFFGQAPQTYHITITATSGTIQHSVNVTLNVQ